MSKQALKSIHNLIKMAVQEAPVEQQFLQDLKTTIERVEATSARVPSQTYKPSSMTCIRNMYYQVTGTEPDDDRTGYCLVGISQSGTDRHERLQSVVSKMCETGVECEYIDVAKYVVDNNLNYLQIKGQQGFETKLYHKDLNISFLCDGIIKYKGEYYILEIKTESLYKWQVRTFVDDTHLDQATTYSICFGIDKVMFVYECRDNCDKKCYLLEVTEDMKANLLDKIETCDHYVNSKTVPPIPKDVPRKSCNYCKYRNTCKGGSI